MSFDKNGNLDVMGSRDMSAPQMDRAQELRELFNALHQKCMRSSQQGSTESARLYAIARTQLELACMAAIKAISRE